MFEQLLDKFVDTSVTYFLEKTIRVELWDKYANQLNLPILKNFMDRFVDKLLDTGVPDFSEPTIS